MNIKNWLDHINKHSLFYQKVWISKSWGPIYNLKSLSSKYKYMNSIFSNLKQFCSCLHFEAKKWSTVEKQNFLKNKVKSRKWSKSS